eukprot:CAMPEP_0182863576 /NCGR_PEP_ID=MMETSP0034_2-20130328/6724_1 /TAXON_ID=156128 /ORGANISM="Nephroselmis pyriformis, Strain CCMP717" /LENGTH=610 /DNA_ID=CAMNT_0024995807 /DNA_START=91 /DNA_END=1923 /DNA_ORIENTATION=-
MGCGQSTPVGGQPIPAPAPPLKGPAPAPATMNTPEKAPPPPSVEVPEPREEPSSEDPVSPEMQAIIDAAMPASAKQAMEAPVVSDRPIRESNLPADIDVTFLLGGPGSGKGTQAAKIVARYACVHLSSGDLLRKEVAEGSHLGKMAEKVMASGDLLPTAIMVGIVRGAMLRAWVDHGTKKFLIDGFPRTLEQAASFEEKIGTPARVISLDCPQEVMESRCLGRGQGRIDDSTDAIMQRYHLHMTEAVPVVEMYAGRRLAFVISSVPPVDEVFDMVSRAMDGFVDITSPTAMKPHGNNPEVAEDDWEVVFIMGGPGSGKGTACQQLVLQHGFTHLSSGDVLRAEVASQSSTGQQCQAIMANGGLVPIHVICGLMRIAMVNSKATKFLIDGFPRSLQQAAVFEEIVKPPMVVLYFACSSEEAESRILRRGIVADTSEVIRKRIDLFQQEGMPVVTHYSRSKATNFAEIDAMQPIDVVVAAASKAFSGLSPRKTRCPKASFDYEDISEESRHAINEYKSSVKKLSIQEEAAPPTAEEAAPAAEEAAPAAEEAAPAAEEAAPAAEEAAPAAEEAAPAAEEAAPAAEEAAPPTAEEAAPAAEEAAPAAEEAAPAA